ncbi:Fmp45p NDAI_0H03830 [Naumovozyma dairenensis CBS 421]|uniref:Uncharacterized protein n=1 Tax=Naumovozyma dairenensis (strain ATCC 10597 / BCRC 20456 / CBS 421 / NBRC 0211 / NRRL Y-12639) TaxID=1071378 RepID=G0WFJ5_NAUDC|nr:hypothetical protein NDAI_0H03830 [Naumovozyma dairenensis CBS 421]CCD26556.1 hypothetical protein NDAI_0H03830 [Naumovozyma dairenensis CBS 421]
MQFKRFVNPLSFLFLLGAGLLTLILIISGGRDGGILKNFYWFQGDTNGFNNAPSTTRWFNYQYCGYENGQLMDCSSRGAAKPFSPRDNFGSSPNMPSTFLNNRDTYYYLSKVAWAMLLIGTAFTIFTIVPQFISFFLHRNVTNFITMAFSWIAFFFLLLAACLYTGCYVKARKAFHHDDRDAHMGAKNFGFIWASVALMLINSIATTVYAALHKRDNTPTAYDHSNMSYPEYDNSAAEKSTIGSSVFGKKKMFKKTKKQQGYQNNDATMTTNPNQNVVADDGLVTTNPRGEVVQNIPPTV